MTSFNTVTIFRPKDWQLFERNTRLLFEHSLGDPHTQNNGRQGQPQHGVDVFGRRGGHGGPMVGVQCKGRDANFGEPVSEKELRAEVKKSEQFTPGLKEFFLVTTAQDDGEIQNAARLLEDEVRAEGRDLSISVWGWGRLEQEIIRFPEAIRAFQPDAMPYGDRIVDDLAEIKAELKRQAESSLRNTPEEANLKPLSPSALPTQIATDTQIHSDPFDRFIHNQIDTYRDLIRNGQSRIAIELLTKLREQIWITASNRVRFRILSNLGAAHHRIGEYDRAADFFLEAAQFNADDPIGFANKIAALLIKGQTIEAHKLAIEAFDRFPDNADIAMQRLQALGPAERPEDIWPTLPANATEKPEFLIYLITQLRSRGDSSWRATLTGALDRYPEDVRLKSIQAESVLENLVKNDPNIIGRSGPDVPTPAQLASAADAFEAMWNEMLRGEAPVDGTFAHNAALLRHFLHQNDRAAALLDAALQRGFSHEESGRLRVVLYLRAGLKQEAIKLADSLEDNPQVRIIRADLRVPEASDKAREILSNREEFTEPRLLIAASTVVIDSYIAESNRDAALNEAEKLKSLLPHHPHATLCVYQVKRANAETDANELLTESVRQLKDDTDFITRFFIAEALFKAERPDETVDVLRNYASTHYDSPALRTLIAAAANSDRRAVLKDILDHLPRELNINPFYRNARIALAIRAGNISAAEIEIRAFLAEHPRSLELHLQLLHALFRQNRFDELRFEAQRPASDFDGTPIEYMRLAQFMDDFGDWKEAHKLSYKTLLANLTDAAVNSAYVANFLHLGHSKNLDPAPSIVEKNRAVGIAIESGSQNIYIIEPDPQLRPNPQYIAPDHQIAVFLIGKSSGTDVILPDGTKGKIEWIKPKEIYQLHEILNNFKNFFPESEGPERISFTLEQAGVQQILDRVRQRHDATEQIASIYDSGNIPIIFIGKVLGIGPVDAFYGLISTGHSIRTCLGSQQERDAAFAAIDANSLKGCVIDSITLQSIRILNIADAVENVCGPIGTTAATRLRVQQRTFELEQRLDEKGMTMFWRDGQYYRQEITPEHQRQLLREIETESEWLASNTETLLAQGTKDPSPAFRELLNNAGSDLFDDIIAADGSGRLLISDDQAIRILAIEEFSAKVTWLQPVLMKAVQQGHLTRQDYLRAIIHFIDCKLEFITVDSELMLESLSVASGHSLPDSFSKLASRLGGTKADLASHMSVAFRTMHVAWRDNNLSSTVRMAAVGRFLENLTKERPLDQFWLIVRQFIGFGQRVLHDQSFVDYVIGWLRFHFMPPPNDASTSRATPPA